MRESSSEVDRIKSELEKQTAEQRRLETEWHEKLNTAAALSQKPELSGTAIILVAIPETMVILGFVVAILILLQLGGK